MLKRSFLIVLLVSGLLAPSALARTTVHLDRSFGVGGTVEGKFGPAYSPTAFTAIAPQFDGSLLATRGDGVNPGGWIRRYAADGTLDPGFPAQAASTRVEAVDAEGRLLRGDGERLERFNPDGTPDPSFGRRPWGAPNVSDPTGFLIERIVPLPSGKILVAGSVMVYVTETRATPAHAYVEQVAVARFGQEGALDATFGNGGVVRLKSDIGVGGQAPLGIEPRPGGRVAVVVLDKPRSQWGPNAVHSPSTFVALDASGRLDSSFAAGTIRTAGTIESFDVLADGSVTLAGERWGPRVEPPYEARFSDVFVNRYTAAGQPDPGFGGGDGSVVLDLADIDLLAATLWEDDGSIWLGGASSRVKSANCRRFRDYCPETPYLVRLTAAGTPDPGFDGDGIVLPDRLANPYGDSFGGRGVLALAARPGGGVYAGGASGVAGFIAAVLPSGAFDPVFGSGGILIETEPHESNSAAHAIATDRRGRLLVVGRTGAGAGAGGGALFRYLRDGRLDRGFAGGSGFVRIPSQGRELALAADGGAFVLGGESETVTKVREDGRVDQSYGEEGTTVLPVAVPIARRGRTEYLFVEIASIAALPGGRLLLAGTASTNESRAVLFRLRADGSFDPSFGKGGTVIRSFGASGRCRVNQMVLRPDGRILLAGQVMSRPNESPRTEALAVMRLLANGRKDRGFGRRGLVVKRLGQRSYASALAIEGNGRIVVGGRVLGEKPREVLLRLTANGRLDRSFGRGGVTTARVPKVPGGLSGRSRQVILQPNRILVLRDHRRRQLVVYSRDGRRRAAFEVARGAVPGNRAPAAPFGALQGGRLALGWQVYGSPRSLFKLQRLRIGGRP